MTRESEIELYETVMSHINTYGEQSAMRAIWDAHNGRPDGWLVTNENLHLFRQYRNSIDPRPMHMIESTWIYHRSKWEKGKNNGIPLYSCL